MGLPSILNDIPFKQVKVAQSCPILCNPVDYTVHEILQARILEWVAFPFSRGSSQPRDQTQVSHIHCRWILYQLSHKGSLRILECVPVPSPADFPNPGIEPGTWAQQLRIAGLQNAGSNNCGTWAQLLRGMWDLPSSGINSCLLYWVVDSLPLHQGSLCFEFFKGPQYCSP